MGTDDASSAVKRSDDDQSLPVAEDTDEGIASGLKNYLRVFTYNDRLGWLLNAVSILCMIASGAALPLMNIVFGKFINIFNHFVSGDLSAEAYKREIGKFSLYFVYLFVAKLILVYIWSVLFSITAIRTVKNLRVDFLRQTLHQEISFFDNLSTSIAGQIATNGNMVHNGISEKLGITIQATSTFVAAFIVAFISQWKLTLILCCIPPLNVAVTLIGFRYVEKYDAQMYEFFGKADALAEEALSTIRAVHAFWAFPKLSSRYRDIVWNAKKNGGDQQTPLFMVIYPVQFFGILAGYGLAFWRGINMFSSGEVTEPGTVVTVILATIVAAQSLTQITPQIVVIGKAAAAARELFAIIDRKSAIDPYSTSGSKVTEFSGAIELKNVNFSYPSRPHVPVLRNFSLNVPANKTIALVGASGSGKSTIIGLLERWYSLGDGKITLDGQDLNGIDLEWLRTNMRLVQQEPTLFSGTIYQNVADGFTGTILDRLPEEEKHILVREACQATFAHEFITALPQAYDTWLNERGGSLSGGQKQRLVIARAIVSNPKVLLLDEATSALDPQAEKIVQKAINNIAVNRTILVIAHRLSTIRNAHSIVVMSKGEVVEQGTHSELVAAKGTYAKLVEAQNLGEGDENEVNVFNKSIQKSDQPWSATTSHASDDAVVSMPTRVSHGLFKGIYLIVREQKKLWLPTLCTIIQGIIGGATYPALAVLFAWSLEAFQTPDVGRGNFYALMFFVVALVNGLGYIVAGGYSNYMAQHIMCYYRADAFSSTLRQDMSYFDHPENSTGTLTSRIASEPYNIVEIVAYNFLYIIINIVNVVASAILAIAYGWKLGLVLALGGLPILMAAGYARIRLEFKFEEEAAERFAQSSGIATESVLAIRTVSSLALEKKITRRYDLSLQRIANDTIMGLGWKMLFYALSQSASFLVMGLGFWYGGHLVLTGEYSTRQFYTIFAAIVFSGEAVAYFFQFTISFSKGRSSINYILSLRESQVLLETDAAKEDIDGHESCADKSGQQSEQGKAILFGGVDFAYPLRQDTKVLHDINIEVVPGTMVAFVGASGCGKSTMIALMERFYDPIRGSIRADNLDLKEQSRFHYRKDVALVQQEPVLYQGSIRENISLGIEEGQPSDQEVVNACKQANIWEFVSSLPEGLATLCGSQGYSLSGGQRQRIAIARALIRKPRLLLLDEATSALDTESEKVVKAALDKAASGRTTIAVAHRLSTVRDADLIIVFDKGAVVERGTHDQLLAQRGVYFEMVKGQSLDKEVL